MNKGKFTPAWRHKKLCGRILRADRRRCKRKKQEKKESRKIEMFKRERKLFLCSNKCYNTAWSDAAAAAILLVLWFPLSFYLFVSKCCSLVSFSRLQTFSSSELLFFPPFRYLLNMFEWFRGQEMFFSRLLPNNIQSLSLLMQFN